MGTCLETMRNLSPILPLLCLVFFIGCAAPSTPLLASTVPHRESALLLLDNRGGFSHAGRRVALQADGSFTDTTYTDVVGDGKARRGAYTLNAEKTHLVLSPESGDIEHLYRVNYGGEQYWVHDQDRARTTQASQSWFRQISLRVVP